MNDTQEIMAKLDALIKAFTGEQGINEGERKLNAEERKVNAEERRINAEERRVNAEERRVNAEERRVNAEERRVNAEERKLNEERYRYLLDLFLSEQAINTSRYQETRSQFNEINQQLSRMVTRDSFDRSYRALSEDIQAMFGDHDKLKKRVTHLEKQVTRLEEH